MSRFISPLRYPGGKGKIYKEIKNIIIHNNYNNCIYTEPFAGGAAIALKLLSENVVNNIHINDFDISIYSIWYSILNKTNELISLINKTPITIDEWYKQKDIQNNKNTINDVLKLGFSTLFLNRTNRSGVINGGPIGGKNQNGKYLINCRFNKEDIINRIKFIASYNHKIKLTNFDATCLLKNIEKSDNKYFIYMDPPYYVKGKQLYMNFFKHEDHEKLKKQIFKSQNPWIITYDNVPNIHKIYKDCQFLEYDLTYSAGSIKSGKEVLIYKKGVQIPKNLFVKKTVSV